MMNLRKFLTYAGTVPFLLSALFILTGKGGAYPENPYFNVMITYGAVILSFLAGSYWGVTLSPIGHSTKISRFFGVFSITISLSAWLCLLNRDDFSTISILIIGFLTCLWTDEYLKRDGLIDRDYFKTRIVATFCAVLSLAVALYFIP